MAAEEKPYLVWILQQRVTGNGSPIDIFQKVILFQRRNFLVSLLKDKAEGVVHC